MLIMKKLTIRVDDYILDRINLVAKDNNTSANKVANSILEKYINEPKEINYLKELDKQLKLMNDKLETISQRQYIHLKISKQHFANFGYLSNAVVEEDKCLNQLLNNKDLFND